MSQMAVAAGIVATGAIAAGGIIGLSGGSDAATSTPSPVTKRVDQRVASVSQPTAVKAARFPKPKPKAKAVVPSTPVNPAPTPTPVQSAPSAPAPSAPAPKAPEYGPVVVAPAGGG